MITMIMHVCVCVCVTVCARACVRDKSYISSRHTQYGLGGGKHRRRSLPLALLLPHVETPLSHLILPSLGLSRQHPSSEVPSQTTTTTVHLSGNTVRQRRDAAVAALIFVCTVAARPVSMCTAALGLVGIVEKEHLEQMLSRL